eukprot:9617990-Alexandrium_andersonii.AAC.1
MLIRLLGELRAAAWLLGHAAGQAIPSSCPRLGVRLRRWGFRVGLQGFGFKLQGAGASVHGSAFLVQEAILYVLGPGCGVQGP